jgi:hypothetical protein
MVVALMSDDAPAGPGEHQVVVVGAVQPAGLVVLVAEDHAHEVIVTHTEGHGELDHCPAVAALGELDRRKADHVLVRVADRLVPASFGIRREPPPIGDGVAERNELTRCGVDGAGTISAPGPEVGGVHERAVPAHDDSRVRQGTLFVVAATDECARRVGTPEETPAEESGGHLAAVPVRQFEVGVTAGGALNGMGGGFTVAPLDLHREGNVVEPIGMVPVRDRRLEHVAFDAAEELWRRGSRITDERVGRRWVAVVVDAVVGHLVAKRTDGAVRVVTVGARVREIAVAVPVGTSDLDLPDLCGATTVLVDGDRRHLELAVEPGCRRDIER